MPSRFVRIGVKLPGGGVIGPQLVPRLKRLEDIFPLPEPPPECLLNRIYRHDTGDSYQDAEHADIRVAIRAGNTAGGSGAGNGVLT